MIDAHHTHPAKPGAGDVVWHWLTFVIVLLTIPAFYLELAATSAPWRSLGSALYAFVVVFFSVRLMRAIQRAHSRSHFFAEHWLDALVALGAIGSLISSFGPWSATEWVLRLLFILLVMARIVSSLRSLLSPAGALVSVGFGATMLALAGAGFYWLEPTAKSYADGLWLAFVTGSSVGYGDLVPTTIPSKIFAGFVVLMGYALMSFVTASLVSVFVGQDEDALRREMHHDVKRLREEIAALREDVRAMRAQPDSAKPKSGA
jgi:voltage-gated potassium channel